MIKTVFIPVLLMLLICFQALAAIQVSVDVSATPANASTTSNRVYIERIELSFPNNRASQTVNQHSAGLYAKASFKYLGNGPLTIRWMVDGRVFFQSSEILTFGREVVIRSDKNNIFLPTFERGEHKVSLELSNSAGSVAVNIPTIKYFVADGVAEIATNDLRLMYPNQQQLSANDLRFRWQGSPAFDAYEIEVQTEATRRTRQITYIRAVTDMDVYAPSEQQLSRLGIGNYRWRITGLFNNADAQPVVTEWADFSLDQGAGGIFISGIQTTELGNSNDPAVLSQATVIQAAQLPIDQGNRLTRSQQFIASGIATGGRDYALSINIQNSQANNIDDLSVEVYIAGNLQGVYPVSSIDRDSSREISLPISFQSAQLAYPEMLDVVLISGAGEEDQAVINLNVIPDIVIEDLDFNERENNFSSDLSLSFCPGGGIADSDLVFSRMVSASSVGQSSQIQTINRSGYFTFDRGQTLQLTAYLEDRGLGEWLAEHCPSNQTTSSSGREFVVRNNPRLKFVAYRVDGNAQVAGPAIEIGAIAFESGVAGMVTSPEWSIPNSGQYKITLHDISEPVDLYATLPGGFPTTIRAAGFDLRVTGWNAEQSEISGLREVRISGSAETRWKGDSSEKNIPLQLANVSLEMTENPLIGQYISGDISLTNMQSLVLQGQLFELNEFIITQLGAKATLAYFLPENYIQSSAVGTTNLLNTNQVVNISAAQFTESSTASRSAATANITRTGANSNARINSEFISNLNTGPVITTAVSRGQPISFDDVDVFNGGEFIARFAFSSQWQDFNLQGDDLALRLRGGELIVDNSPHVNYSDYTSQSAFTGIGLSNVMLRVAVTPANNLFAVNNVEQAYIYGKANWLEIDSLDSTLSGEEIEVQVPTQVADFFNQAVAQELELSMPFGFKLQIFAGIFGLDKSIVGGVDFRGSLALPENEATSVISNHQLSFEHLRRSGAQYVADIMSDSTLELELGVFNYQPQTLRLIIGHQTESDAAYSYNENAAAPNFNAMNQQGISSWLDSLNLSQQAGLIMYNGELSKGWNTLNNENSSQMSQGKFLLTAAGLKGQWLDINNTDPVAGFSPPHYLINGFDISLQVAWFKFSESVLLDSKINGFINIPYPVDQQFAFSGGMDQELGLDIAENALKMPPQVIENGYWDLHYWQTRLYAPLQNNSAFVLSFNKQEQLISIENLPMSLQVTEAYGGIEFSLANQNTAASSSADLPAFFLRRVDINPSGQLLNAQITANTSATSTNQNLAFIGQNFSLESIEFREYIGNGQRPVDENGNPRSATSTPLLDINGQVNFSVLGPQSVTINHTATGAKVPEISPVTDPQFDGVNEGYGEGAIRVTASLKFINTYGRSSEAVANEINQTTGANSSPEAFKAFVGAAEITLINAIKVKGLAEAGLHKLQRFPTETPGNPGEFWVDEGNDIVAYERIGLGFGADIVKTALAGLRGMETVAELGGAGIAAVTGAEGVGEEIIELGVETTSFISSLVVVLATQGATPEEIRNAIDNGLSTTNKALELLLAICQDQAASVDCNGTTIGLLNVGSIMARSAGVITSFNDIEPQEIASIVLQTLDVSIPVLKTVNLNAAVSGNAGVSLNAKANFGLSLAHTQVAAARSLVDNNGQIPFADFITISNRFITTLESLEDIPEFQSNINGSQGGQLFDLSIKLARESVNMAEELSTNPNPQKLAELTAETVGLICGEVDNLNAMLPQEIQAIADVGSQILKPVMNVSSGVLQQLAAQGASLPSDPQQLTTEVLAAILTTLSSDSISAIAGCGSSSRLPPEIRALLKLASHSLNLARPGALNSTSLQIQWAMDGVAKSLEVLIPIAQNTSAGMVSNQLEQLKEIFSRLASTFGDTDMSDEAMQNGTAVLQLAGGIPAAFNDLVRNTGGSQAAEILDIYIELMQQLSVLIVDKDAIAQGDFSRVDLFALPLALINKTQNLSLLDQKAKLGLENIALSLSMAQELSSLTAAGSGASLQRLLAKMSVLHSNSKLQMDCELNSANPVCLPQLDQAMAVLNSLAKIAADSSQAQAEILSALPDLIPLLVNDGSNTLQNAAQSTAESAAAISLKLQDLINPLVAALPLADFTQDDRARVLDATLLRLLNEAEEKASAEDKLKIARAKNIILHGDMNIVGLSISYAKDQFGNDILDQVLAVKQVRNDGSYREFNFAEKRLTQYFPEAHVEENQAVGYPAGINGLEEFSKLNLANDFNFNQLDEENKITLFNEFWTQGIFQADPITRRYKDSAGNKISMAFNENIIRIIINEPVSNGNFSASRELELNTTSMGSYEIAYPPAEDITTDIGGCYLCEIINATVIISADKMADYPACSFTGGCAFKVLKDSGEFRVISLYNPQHYAIYSTSDSIVYFSISDINLSESATEAGFSNAVLKEYRGPIIADANTTGWQDTWLVNYSLNQLIITEGESFERLAIEQMPSSPQQLVNQALAATHFIQRRRVQGTTVWDYNSTTQNALYSDGAGQWSLYRMPDNVTEQILVPQPTALINPQNNGFELQISSSDEGQTGDIQIAAGDPGNSINISNGQIEIGGVPLSAATGGQAVQSIVSNNGSANNNADANGSSNNTSGTTLTFADGSQRQTSSAQQGNIRVTKTSRPSSKNVNGEVKASTLTNIKIEYCLNRSKTVNTCPAEGRVSRQFSYNSIANYLNLDRVRPPISPIEDGVNKTLKHQLWVDFFRREAALFANPTVQGLKNLRRFANQAIESGLNAEELEQQYGFILEMVSNQALERILNEYETGAQSLNQLLAWKQNQQASPQNEMAQFITLFLSHAALTSSDEDFNIPEIMGDFYNRYFSLLYLSQVTVQQALPEVGSDGKYVSDNLDLEKIKQYFYLFAYLSEKEAKEKYLLGYENDVTIAEMCSFLDKHSTASLALIQSSTGASNMSQQDAEILLNLQSSVAACGGENTLLSEVLAARSGSIELITSNLSIDEKFSRFSNILVAALSGNPLSSYATDAQLIAYFRNVFLATVLQPNSSNLTPAKPENYKLRIQAANYLARLRAIVANTSSNSPDNMSDNDFAAYKTELLNRFQYLQTSLLDGVKRGFRNDYANNIQRLDVQVEMIDAINTLTELYEKGQLLNQTLLSSGFTQMISFDETEYLKLSIMSENFAVINNVSTQQTRWLDSVWLQNLNQTEMNNKRIEYYNLESAVQKIVNAAATGMTPALQHLDSYIEARVESYFAELAIALQPEYADAIEILRWGEQLKILLSSDELPRSNQLLETRANELVAQASTRISENTQSLNLEMLKIREIRRVFGQIADIQMAGSPDPDLANALAMAIASAKTEMITSPSLDSIQRFIDLLAQQHLLGITGDGGLAEASAAMTQVLQNINSETTVQRKLSSIKKLLDIKAQAQALGSEDFEVYNFELESEISAEYVSVVESCMATKSCTFEHYRLYIEYLVTAAALGSNIEHMLDISEMAESSPDTWNASLQYRYQMPELENSVPFLAGRRKAANSLQALVTPLNLDNKADRSVLRNVVEKLRRLAAIPLADGNSLNPDPLETMAGNISRQLYQWQLAKQQQLADILANPSTGPECMQSGQALNSQCMNRLADSLDISPSEIVDTILPAIQYATPLLPVQAGSKYTAAANVLSTLNSNEAWLSLSYRLLSKMPEPNYSAEANYRVTAITQLTAYILNGLRSSVNVAGIGDMAIAGLSDAEVQQHILFALLKVPGESQPAHALANIVKTRILGPLFEMDIKCSAGILPCILNSGLLAVSETIDALLETPDRANPSEKALAVIKNLAINVAEKSSSTEPEEFWMGMAGEGLLLTMDLVSQAGNTANYSDAEALSKNLVIGGLAFSNKFLNAPLVSSAVNQLPQPVPFAFKFITENAGHFQSQLNDASNQAQNFPIVLARMTQNAMFNYLATTDIPSDLLTFGRLLSNWNLNFADANWDSILSTGAMDPEIWLSSFSGEEGMGQLACDINASGLIELPSIPPAIVLSPVIAMQELIAHKDEYDRENKPKLIIDVAAGMANLWLSPMACKYSPQDKALALMLRGLKNINVNNGGELAAISTVGNLSLSGLRIIMGSDPAFPALDYSWNGVTEGQYHSPGVADALALGMQGENIDPVEIITFAAAVPATMAKVIEVITTADSPAAYGLRLLSGNVQQTDLLVPDTLMGPAGSAVTGQAIDPDILINKLKLAIPNGLLAILGSVRKVMTPEFMRYASNSDPYYIVDPSWGYLKTMPFISVARDGTPELVELDVALREMQASGENSNVATKIQKAFIAGADVARLGINSLAPLLDGNTRNANIAAIEQRAIFNELVGPAGFSGISGGVQRQWSATSGNASDESIQLQIFGKLTLPPVVESVGLMEFYGQGNDVVLTFNSAGETGQLVSLVGNIGYDFNASFSNVDNQLTMDYRGDIGLDFLGREAMKLEASGFIYNFTAPQANSDAESYALDLLKNISIGQCVGADAQLVNPPLSFLSANGTGATVGATAFVQKDGMKLLSGSRFAMSAALYFPVLGPSLGGIDLSGDMTWAYGGGLDADGSLALSMNGCLGNGVNLVLFGQEIPLAEVDMKMAAYVSGVKSGIKLSLGSNDRTSQGVYTLLGCDNAVSADVAFFRAPFCEVARNYNTLWLALEDKDNKITMVMGIGPHFPEVGETPLYIKSQVGVVGLSLPILYTGLLNPLNNQPLDPPLNPANDAWAGWPEVSDTTRGVDLCAERLCAEFVR